MGTNLKASAPASAVQPLNALIAARPFGQEPAWLQALRTAACADFNAAGLPGKRWESWHYSAADVWLQQFSEQQGLAPIAGGADAAAEFPSSNQLQFSHGHLLSQQLDAQITLLPLQQLSTDKHAELINWLGEYPHKDSLASLATALAPESWVLIIPANAQIAEPIAVSHHTTLPGAQIAQLIVWVEAGAKATLLENFSGADSHAALQIAHTQMHVGDNAKLTYVRMNRDAQNSRHLGVFEADLQRDAQLRAQVLRGGDSGGANANQKQRNGLYIRLQKNGAELIARGAFAASGAQHIDYHLTVEHNADHGRCDMQVQGIAGDKSRGVVNGRIYIAKNTRDNDGHFTSHNLLLSNDAEIDTKPELEIYADEVRCNHGATVGQFDEDQLLYLATRGIDRTEAIALLTEGFLKAGLLETGTTALDEFLQQQLLASIGGGA